MLSNGIILQSQHDRNFVMYVGENTYLKGFDNYDVILFTKDGNKLAINVENFIEYIGEKWYEARTMLYRTNCGNYRQWR